MIQSELDATRGLGVATTIIWNTRREAVSGASWLLNSATAEAMTFQKGLEFVQNLGCKIITAEYDALEAIQPCGGLIDIWKPNIVSLQISSTKIRELVLFFYE